MTDPTYRNPLTTPFGLTDVGSYAAPTFVDIDDDGDLDAFVGEKSGNTLFLANTGSASNPTFAAASTNPFGLAVVFAYASPTFVDIDGDGDLDAFVGNRSGSTVFFRNIGTASNPVFSAPTTNPFGLTGVVSYSKPRFADIDDDGDLDAFIGNVDGDIFFFRNTGTATNPLFAAASTNPFGLSNVGDLAAPTFADIDGDGDLDALVGNRDGNTLFFRNTATATNPTFAVASTNPFGLIDVGLFAAPTFADIDGDGDLDALVGNKAGNTLFFRDQPVLPTPADPTFAAASTNPFGLAEVGFSAAPTFVDIDGDGDLDALVGNSIGNTLFFRNTGTATNPLFAAASTNPFGLSDVGSFSTPTFVDIDGDGDLDALVGNYDGNTLFFRNTGSVINPLFATAITNPFGLSDIGEGAAPKFVDIDGDGDLDALVGNRDGNTLFFRNTATATNPTFAVASTNPFGLTDVGLFAAPTFADIDGDGDLDALVGNRDGNTLFFRNTGTAINPLFVADSTNPFGLTDVGISAKSTFVDIDGDGDLDALVGQEVGDTLLFRNTIPVVNPQFAAASTNPFGLADVGDYAIPALVDIDGDGDLDALVGNQAGNFIFFRNTGTAIAPAFVADSSNPFGLTNAGGSVTPTFVDIDNDGDFDAFVGEGNGNTVFFVNTGSATNPAFATSSLNPFGLTDVGTAAMTTFADIDGDGDFDAFIGNKDGNTVFFANTGSAALAAFATSSLNPFGLTDVGAYASPTFADIDGDGDLDALVGNRYGESFYFSNTGSASNPLFATSSLNPFGLSGAGTFIAPRFADIDSDGDLDALVGNINGDTVFFRNTIPVVNPQFATSSLNPFDLVDVGIAATPTFVDIDGDGDFDAFVGEKSGNTLFFRNTGSAANPLFAAANTNPFGLSDVGDFAAPSFADIDGDGDLDAFVGDYYGYTRFFRNTGSATNPLFAPASTNHFGLVDVGNIAIPTFADIDGDGDLDAFVGNKSGNTFFFRNTGTAIAPAFATSSLDPFGLTDVGFSAIPTFADIDGDGDLDAFVGNNYGNTFFFRNTGSAKNPRFAASSTNPFGLTNVGIAAAPTFADIDGDGDLDALVGNLDGNTTVFFGNRTPTTNADTVSTNVVTPLTIAASTLLANDSDLDRTDTLRITTVSGAVNGSVSFSDNGTPLDFSDDVITFTPTTPGVGSFQYTMSDGNGGTAQGTVNVRIGTNQSGGTGNDILTGNVGPDILNGNSGHDSLVGITGRDRLLGGAGNDTLNGGTKDNAPDTLIGGKDNDIYRIGKGDIVIEAVSEGIDRIEVDFNYSLVANVENLTLLGSGNINGTGNALANIILGNSGVNSLVGDAGNDRLLGGVGNDTLNGGLGADTMIGGKDSDTYNVDNNLDIITELANEGTDIVNSIAVNYTLSANIENLTLQGTANINATGNSIANRILGNRGNNSLVGGASNDILTGGAGNDTLTGGTGADRFVFGGAGIAFSFTNLGSDIISDFATGVPAERISLSKSTFSALTSSIGGVLSAAEFATVTTDAQAATSTALITYNSNNGKLFYNQNGALAGLGTGARFATLLGTPAISASSFEILV